MATFIEYRANGWGYLHALVPSLTVDALSFHNETATSGYFRSYSGYSTGNTFANSTAIYASSGSNLSYSYPTPTTNQMVSGTVASVFYETNSGSARPFSSSQTGLYISGANYDAATLQSFINANDPSGLWRYQVAGDDVFYVANGSDTVYAGAGSDQIYVSGTGDKVLLGGLGANYIYSGGGNDFIWAGEQSTGSLNASIWSVVDAGLGNDYVFAGVGANSSLSGGAGNDYLADGAGTDILNGGAGYDTFNATSGVNILNFGWDSIVSGEYDVVLNFNTANNYIQLANGLQPYATVADYAGGAYVYVAGLLILAPGATAAGITSHLYYA